MSNRLYSRREESENEGCLNSLCALIFYVVICLWTDNNLDFFSSHYSGKPVDFPAVLVFIFGYFFTMEMAGFCTICFIIRLFL